MNNSKNSHNSYSLTHTTKTHWRRISGYVTMSVLGIFALPSAVEKATMQHIHSSMTIEKPINNKPSRRDPAFDASLGRIVAMQSGLDESLQTVDTKEITENYSLITEQNKHEWKKFVGHMEIFSENPHFVVILQKIFEQESHFNPHAISDTGAVGIAQLTSDVFSDMKASHRGVRYFRLLRAIQQENSEILQALPSDFRLLIEAMPEKISHKDWEEIRKNAYMHRKDPFVNMLIGGMALSVNHSVINEKEVSFFRDNFLKHLNDSSVWSPKMEYKLHTLSNDELKMILAGKKYNGNDMMRNFYYYTETGEHCSQYDARVCQSVQMPENWIYVRKLMQNL